MSDILCELPYRIIHIDATGDVRSCCIGFCNDYSYGNIFEEPFSQVWNGEKAQEFRRQFFTKDYKYCNISKCLPFKSNDGLDCSTPIAKKYPISILLELDDFCPQQCVFCPPRPNRAVDLKDNSFEKWGDELFANASLLNPGCSGEVLASPFLRNLIKYTKKFPNLKIELITNGLLFDEKNIKELELEDRLVQVEISFHSLKEKNYNQLVKKSDFKKVMKNVHYAISLKKQNKINRLIFCFVITSVNYKEMIPFAKFAKKNNAEVIFKNCLQYHLSDEHYKELDVFNPENKHYNDVIRILKHPIFKESFIRINQDIFNLESNKNTGFSFFSKFFKKN